jgi:hypothetical protein
MDLERRAGARAARDHLCASSESEPEDDIAAREYGVGYNLGDYVIIHKNTVVRSESDPRESGNTTVAKLPYGAMVRVTQVLVLTSSGKVRGRIDKPCGWITLGSLQDGHRWAVPLVWPGGEQSGSESVGTVTAAGRYENAREKPHIENMREDLEAQPAQTRRRRRRRCPQSECPEDFDASARSVPNQTCSSVVSTMEMEDVGLRPLKDGYCGVSRPSLTDSKLRGQSPALAQNYQLLPPSRPKRRPWMETDGAIPWQSMYLEHQMWRKEQGLLYFSWMKGTSFSLPRLGVVFQVTEVHSVDPTTGTWHGKVMLHLSVACEETLGLVVREDLQGDDLRRQWERVQQAWPEQEGGSPSDFTDLKEPMAFLTKVFGVRFYNLVKGSVTVEEGPSKMSDLSISKGVIENRWVVEGTFSVPVELSDFPFETLSWDVIVSIIGWSPGIMDGMKSSSLSNVAEFDIYGLQGLNHASKTKLWVPYCCESNVVPNEARYSESLAYCRFHSRRRPALSVMTNIVLPMCLMAILGVVGVMQAAGSVQNPNSETDGVALEATLLLTVTAMRFNYADAVPKSQLNPTLLDKYIISIMLLLVFTTMGIVLFREEQLGFAPLLYIVVVVLIHAYFVFCAWRALRIPVEKKGELLYKTPHAPPELPDLDQPVPMGFVTKAGLSK